jgi:hypothetical protein
MGKPSSEGAQEKAALWGERETGGHADENAEPESEGSTNPDCRCGTQRVNPIHRAIAFESPRATAGG